MIVMGIDPSLTSTGWVVLKDGIVKESGTIESKEKGVKRLLEIEEAIEDAIYHLQPKIVYIEGYAFSQANKAHAMGELGGVLRRRLWKLKLKESIKTWNEIQPSAVKKFATGKGNAKKEDMKLAVFKKWGVEFATNDETDAFVLAKMAEVEANGDTMPQASTKAKGSTKKAKSKK